MKISRNPENIHSPVAPYVHQIEVTGPNKWLTLSGQLGMKVDGTVPENPVEQLTLALDNIRKNLEAAITSRSLILNSPFKLSFYRNNTIFFLFNLNLPLFLLDALYAYFPNYTPTYRSPND